MTGLLVALGGLVGAPLRYLLGELLDRRLPWGILAANVAGSFVLGLVVGLDLGTSATALLGVGFCGGLTTYSTFAVQTWQLPRGLAVLNASLTVVLAVLAATLGFVVGQA